ncbi:response regulator [Curvivirga sp.]|uniref:response regulator n=1 Tax=Curvivirga sp. TaxID=2856848 RepID=UPI003B5BDF6D
MSQEPHILIVDDDLGIQKLLKKFLSQFGFRVTLSTNGQEMRKALEDWQIDLVVLDVMLPGEDGFALCKEIRQDSNMPIIMLTAVNEEYDRILGLELGADDYLTKPFNPRELMARIKAILRRVEDQGELSTNTKFSKAIFGNWTLNINARELADQKGVVTHLSSGEFALLVTLLQNSQRVLSREQLVDITRKRSSLPFDRSIDIQISRLRKKIETDPKAPHIIKTIRGQGYQFCCEAEFT